ncbi:hypothetical protein NliqN6_5600 [Naganishia liquefaciens]|uniref:C3H1-type domain-containing protein n=1 Tax=Naganishia liquefaciens TaxID=104408 RepID=A0A8H3YHB9_9TREE|nr:hypothetical protein NliqN6_5600 [Naganishia liquefaciens]
MTPTSQPNNGLPAGNPTLPPNPYGLQPPNPQMMQYSYLQMQMAMQQQMMQSRAYGYGAQFNPQMLMRQSLFQPVNYQSTQNEQGYTYSSSYLEQQQQQQQQYLPQSNVTASTSANPPTASRTSLQDQVTRPIKKPRVQNGPANSNNVNGGAWRNCVQDGCAFVGPEKDVALHEQDRHLIYKTRHIERSEEEEAAVKKAGPAPPIPGTSIRLETEEDIAKWIAQRRARWPTAARVEEKEKERQEKVARGEIDPNAAGRGRRGRGRGGTRGGRGRGGFEAATTVRTRDAGYQNRSQPSGKESSKAKKEQGSESSSGSDTSDSSDSETDDDNDDLQADPQPSHNEKNPTSVQTASTPTASRICKFFAKTGRCRNGRKCHFVHERQRQDTKPARKQPPSTLELNTTSNRPSLLAALLENPINQTLSSLSQAIDFLVENDFLDGVELIPGECEEATAHNASQTENLVQVLNTDQKPMSTSVSVMEPTAGVMGVQDAPDEPTAGVVGIQDAPDEPSDEEEILDRHKVDASERDGPSREEDLPLVSS